MITDPSNSDQNFSEEKEITEENNLISNEDDTAGVQDSDLNTLGKALIEEDEKNDAESSSSVDAATENGDSENKEEEIMKEITIQKAGSPSPDTAEKKDSSNPDEAEQYLSLPDIITRLSDLLKKSTVENWSADSKSFNKYRALGYAHLHAQEKGEKAKWEEEGKSADEFKFENSQQIAFTELLQEFKKIQEAHHKKQDVQQAENLEIRNGIIEKLKNLNSNADAGTNLFKEIRTIKEQWSSAGQVPKENFKIVNNNYFHHLTQFYEILDLKKDFLEQEYAHNLEKREHIIARAKELQTEESVQKALNELQYLHKLWKEEAVPVAEAHREKTWEEFKTISDKIHDRRAELSEQMEATYTENLAKKNAIIEEIKKFCTPDKEPNHNYWQNAIKKIEILRSEFLKTGSVNKKISNQNWQDFKDVLKSFNNSKNNYYKTQKNSQQQNLDDKLKLIQVAKDNNTSEDWETMVSMFKNLQQDWKKIGHVPRSQADKIWTEFREACNVFFDNYRDKSKATGDDWQENFTAKQNILAQLKEVTDAEGSVEKIEELKNAWNAVGKVPKDKLFLHTDFNKTLKEKLKLNNVQEYELKEEGLTEHQITDKARRIKSQISDMEAELAKLENNLGFFNKPSRDNPLLADTFKRIDDKKESLENLKQSLHQMISGE